MYIAATFIINININTKIIIFKSPLPLN